MKQPFVIKQIKKQGRSKIIIVPMNSNFEIGEYVMISKIKEMAVIA